MHINRIIVQAFKVAVIDGNLAFTA
jgi:hypothetical protein